MNPVREFIHRLVQLQVRCGDPPVGTLRPVNCKHPPNGYQMTPLRAYRGPGWALVVYLSDEDEQDAFNVLIDAVPEIEVMRGLDFTLIPPTTTSDPLGQAGWVGVKRKRYWREELETV